MKTTHWRHMGDHNMKRITRVIHSLQLFGLQQEAQSFYELCIRLTRGVGAEEWWVDCSA
jgi:hypothetical protein